MKSERDALAASVQKVDDSVLHGKSAPEFYNSRARGRNGWQHYQRAVALAPGHADRPENPRLRAMLDWVNERGSSSELPANDAAGEWLAASHEISLALADAAACDVLARPFSTSDNWKSTSFAVVPESALWAIASARVELFLAQALHNNSEEEMLRSQSQVARAAEELAILIALSSRRNQPVNLLEGLLALGQAGVATELAVRVSSGQKLTREQLTKLLAAWPTGAPLFGPMLEGELAWMCWLVESEELFTSADGWFMWLPGQTAIEESETGAFVGIRLRREMRKNMLHLQECHAAMIEGAGLATELPKPHETLGMFALDLRQHARRVLQYDVLFRLRKAALELRLMEHDSPLAKQRDKVEEFARLLHGISVNFEGTDCVLAVVPQVFPGLELPEREATVRLRPLP